MANYVVIPYCNGKGWLFVASSALTGLMARFLIKRGGGKLDTYTHKKRPGGFKVKPELRSKYIYKTPFEAIRRLAKCIDAPVKHITNSNVYEIGSHQVQILNPKSRGTTWKFVS